MRLVRGDNYPDTGGRYLTVLSAKTYIKVNNMNIKKQIYISLIIFSFSFNVMSQTCYTNSITATKPTSDFTVNNDGTVTHINTGLMWKVCSEGLDWANDNCTGTITTHTWQEALQIPQTINAGDGYGSNNNKDWRLPNINELLSIVEIQCYNPAINTTIFPSTASSYYWSSSPYAPYSGYAWIVIFLNGDGSAHYGGSYYVRLVRTMPPLPPEPVN